MSTRSVVLIAAVSALIFVLTQAGAEAQLLNDPSKAQIRPGESLLQGEMAGGMISSFLGGEGKETGSVLAGLMGDSSGTQSISDSDLQSAIGPGEKLVFEARPPSTNEKIILDILAPVKMYNPRLTIDFKQYPLANAKSSGFDKRVQNLGNHLNKRLISEEGNITLAFENEILVLRGEVQSEHQKELAELIAKTEPGVDEIRNELTVLDSSENSTDFGFPVLGRP